MEWLECPSGSKSTFYIDLPGGDFPGLGLYAKCEVLVASYNLTLIGMPKKEGDVGPIYTNWLFNDLYGRCGVGRIAAANSVCEWYSGDDGET